MCIPRHPSTTTTVLVATYGNASSRHSSSFPQDFSVIGINDYLFLDGYRKVIEFKSRGRLKNIDTFLPVLEFRLARFAGTEEKLRRINYHVRVLKRNSPATKLSNSF